MTDLAVSPSLIVVWARLMRLKYQSVGVLPFLLGAVLAIRSGASPNPPLIVLGVLAVVCILTMTYLANEYFDYEIDKNNAQAGAFSGGAKVLAQGLVPHRTVLNAAHVSMGLAALAGLAIVILFRPGPLTIPLGIVGILAGYFYTAPPVKLAYRGLGEIAIAFSYGWLAVFIAYYLLAGVPNDPFVHIITIPVALTSLSTMLTLELPDFESDDAGGRKNLVIRLGKRRAVLLNMVVLMAVAVSLLWIDYSSIPFPRTYVPVIPAAMAIYSVGVLLRGDWRHPENYAALSGLALTLDVGTTIALIIALI